MVPSLKNIDHIHVYVLDRAAAEAWYAQVLGFSRVQDLEFWAPNGGPLTIQNGSGSIHIALFEREQRECRSTIAFSASATEFLAWQSHLTSGLGHEVDAVDHDVSWSLYFQDPDGNPYEITSYEYAELSSDLR